MIDLLSIDNLADLEILENELENQYSRESLLKFTCDSVPNYKYNWFHELLCARLEKFYEDVEAGKSPRLMIFAPPRHGKSELASRQFPAWALGKNPDLEVISTSYSADLAQSMGKDVKKRMNAEDYKEMFEDTVLPERGKFYDGVSYDNTNELFQIVSKRGSYRPAGVGGGITGRGADIFIIDDPIKDAKEANSETTRESVWDWYTTTARTRIQPGGGMLIILTRWHKDDLAGRILKRYKEFLDDPDSVERDENDEPIVDNFDVFSFPAIATEDEEFRKLGDPLHPERYPLGSLIQIKNSIANSRFDALYQQSPVTKGGNHIESEWWRWYDPQKPPRFDYKFITADTAQKTKEENDYSVLSCWGVFERRLYFVDMYRGKWKSPTLLAKAQAFWAKHKGDPNDYFASNCRAFYVEDKASGTGLIQTLESPEYGGIPVIPVQRNIDKLTRCEDTAPWIENGSVYLPKGLGISTTMSEEAEEFPNATNDDALDTLMDAVELTFSANAFFYSNLQLREEKTTVEKKDNDEIPEHIRRMYENL